MKWTYTVSGGSSVPQVCGYQSGTNVVALARTSRVISATDFQAVIPLPPQFTGRISVLASTNTLIIGNLGYNDSSYTIASYVTTGSWLFERRVDLKPSYRLNVIGDGE